MPSGFWNCMAWVRKTSKRWKATVSSRGTSYSSFQRRRGSSSQACACHPGCLTLGKWLARAQQDPQTQMIPAVREYWSGRKRAAQPSRQSQSSEGQGQPDEKTPGDKGSITNERKKRRPRRRYDEMLFNGNPQMPVTNCQSLTAYLRSVLAKTPHGARDASSQRHG